MAKKSLDDIFEYYPTPTSVVKTDDPDFTYVKVNQAYCEITQRTEEELIGSSLFESFPENPNEQKPTGHERLLSSFRKVLKTKKRHIMDAIRYDIILDDGNYEEVYWKVINTPILDDKGDVTYILNSANVITEQVFNQRINRLMLDHSEDSFVFIDKNLIIKNFNQRFAENYQDIKGKEVLKGESILNYADPDRRDDLKILYNRVLQGETVEGNLQFNTQHGQTRHFDIKYKPAKDEANQIVGSFISLTEKTKEHHAKLALERNEARYKALVENGNDVIFILNTDAEPSYISPSIENVLGYTQEEAYSLDLMETIHPDDVDIIYTDLKLCFDKPGQPIEVRPARMKHKNGEYRWMGGTITNMLHDPNINGIVDNFRDITERVKAEEKIQKAKDQYQSLVQTIDGIVWEADPETFILKYISPQLKQILGYELEDALGKPGFWEERIHPDHREKVFQSFERALQEGKNHTLEYKFQKSDGEYIWLHDVVTIIHKNGKPDIIRGLIFDVTQQKELEEKLDSAYQLAKIGTWELNLQKEELFWSDFVKKLHEVDPDFVPDLDTALNFYKEGRSKDRIQKVIQRCIQDGIPFDVELQIVTAKNNERWVRAVGEPEFKNGKCIRVYGSTQDITQRKTLEEELQKVHRMAKMGNWEFDAKEEKLIWSDVIKSIFEVEADFQPDSQNAIEFYTKGENRDRVTKAVNDAIEKGIPYDIEHEITTAKGNKKWIRNIGQPEFEDGKCVRVYGTTQDVTDRKKAELELKETNHDLRERIKEQHCLFEISNLNEQKLTVPELAEKTLELIPTGFQFPELTQVEVIINGQHYQTEQFPDIDKDTILSHKNDSKEEIEVSINVVLNTEDELPNGDGREFLTEEKTLLAGISNQIAQKVDQIQKRNELRKAEKKFRNVVEHSTNMFYQHNIDGVLTFVSPQSKEFLGYTPEESKHNWTDFITDHPINKIGEERTKKALETGNVQPPYEMQLETFDGRIIWVEIHEAPLVEDGMVTGIVGSLTDITDRKRYEQQLQESLERYDYVSKATRDAIYDWDIDQDHLHWGDGFTTLFGYDTNIERYPIEKWAENVHPDDIEEARQDLEDTLNDPNLTQWQKEYRFRKNSGEYAYVIENGYIIRNEEGKAIRMIGALRDITEKKTAELEIERAFNEKEAILESIKDAFFALDKNWVVTYWNKEAENVLSKPRDEIIGKNLWEEYEDAKDLAFYNQYHKAVEEQVTVNFEEYYPAVEKWFEVSAYPSENGLSVYFKDITERKKSRQALEHLNEELEARAQELAATNAELEQFAYVASHDLQEPLRMVTGFLTQLDKKYSDKLDEKANQYINFAVDGAQRMRQIILDLLNYSRLNQENMKRELVDLNLLVEEVKAVERTHIKEADAKIIVSDLPNIYANPGPLKQVFQNLINNALKYQKPGNKPVIEIDFSDTKTHWKFKVKDNGIGIRKEFQETVFQIFQRLHTRDQYSGTGIGLAITKKIIERHGGEIWFESEKGKGSTFYFTILKKK